MLILLEKIVATAFFFSFFFFSFVLLWLHLLLLLQLVTHSFFWERKKSFVGWWPILQGSLGASKPELKKIDSEGVANDEGVMTGRSIPDGDWSIVLTDPHESLTVLTPPSCSCCCCDEQSTGSRSSRCQPKWGSIHSKKTLQLVKSLPHQTHWLPWPFLPVCISRWRCDAVQCYSDDFFFWFFLFRFLGVSVHSLAKEKKRVIGFSESERCSHSLSKQDVRNFCA